MRPRNRPFTAWIAIVALLFAQLATAAYACPQLLAAPQAQSDGCDRDMKAPNLCERHCDYGNASAESGKPVALPAPSVSFLRLLPPSACIEGPASSPGAAATGPPPARFTVLRI